MRTFLLLAVVIGSGSYAFGQAPNPVAGECRLALSQSPAIRGLRLAMTVDQTLDRFPGSRWDERVNNQLSGDYFGSQSVSISPGSYGTKEEFLGVAYVSFSFLDRRITSFTVNYNGPQWKSVQQFAQRVAKALNLPDIESWKPDNGKLVLECDGFRVAVRTGSFNSITVWNAEEDVAKTVKQREEVPTEKARLAWKP